MVIRCPPVHTHLISVLSQPYRPWSRLSWVNTPLRQLSSSQSQYVLDNWCVRARDGEKKEPRCALCGNQLFHGALSGKQEDQVEIELLLVWDVWVHGYDNVYVYGTLWGETKDLVNIK